MSVHLQVGPRWTYLSNSLTCTAVTPPPPTAALSAAARGKSLSATPELLSVTHLDQPGPSWTNQSHLEQGVRITAQADSALIGRGL